MPSKRCGSLVGLLCLVAVSCRPREYEAYAIQTALRELKLGDAVLKVEIAEKETERRLGLMHRGSLSEDQGMLFVYAKPQVMSFWMRDTFIPLSIAFLDVAGTILNIEDMQPLLDHGAVSHGAAVYAIEVNQGWFEKHGIKAGQKIELPDWLAQIEAE